METEGTKSHRRRMRSGRRSSVYVTGQNEELFVHEATAEPTSRVTLEKIMASSKEKVTIRQEQIPEIEYRTERWANFVETLQKSDARVEKHVKRLLENFSGDERMNLIDKKDKVTYDIFVQTRDLSNTKEAEKQHTNESKFAARTAEIMKAVEAEDAKLGSALDAAAASLDKTLEKVDRQMDAVCSFAASVGIEKECITQMLAQVSSSAHGGIISQ